MIVPPARKTRPSLTDVLAPLAALCAWLAAALPAGGADAAARLPDAPPLPILAWGGPPEAHLTAERLKELADAGFTHNFSSIGSAEGMARALDLGNAAGVKFLLSIPELAQDPAGTAARFKGHPALAGYYLRDEPAAGDFDGLAKWARRIQAADAAHPCYVNLFPNYATNDQLGAPGYRPYVERFIKEVPVPLVSFDHYPVVGQSLRPEWYENLEIVSAAARAAGKPFWAFALSTAHGPYPIPTTAHLRLQAYSNLAYGAQGLQYFMYWTSKSDTWDFHDGPIGTDGKRTVVYDRVREVNREVQALRGVFVGSRVLAVGHTGKQVPAGTGRYEPSGPVKSLQTEGAGAVVSTLARDRRQFLVVVNRDFDQPMPLSITLDAPGGVQRVEKDGTLHTQPDGRYQGNVGPGDVAILTWEMK